MCTVEYTSHSQAVPPAGYLCINHAKVQLQNSASHHSGILLAHRLKQNLSSEIDCRGAVLDPVGSMTMGHMCSRSQHSDSCVLIWFRVA